MLKISHESTIPIYIQLRDILAQQISEGKFSPGDKITSENELCKQYQISRVTVRNAIQLLIDEGVIVRRHGKGTFVSSAVVFERKSEMGSFTKSCYLMNKKPGTKLISKKAIKIKGSIAALLCTKENQTVFCIKRLRSVDGTPVIFEIDYFPISSDYIMQVDLENTPLLDSIKENESTGTIVFQEIFDVRFANKEQAESLVCPMHTPLLGIMQTVCSSEGKVLYINEQYIRSDIYKYVVET